MLEFLRAFAHGAAHWLRVLLASGMLAMGAATTGVQKNQAVVVLSTAAGATGQVGGVYALPQDWSASEEIAVEIVITGGTFSGLNVTVALSLDGVNFPVNQINDNSHGNNFLVVEAGATAAFAKAPFLQAGINSGVVATGSPVVTVTIWVR